MATYLGCHYNYSKPVISSTGFYTKYGHLLFDANFIPAAEITTSRSLFINKFAMIIFCDSTLTQLPQTPIWSKTNCTNTQDWVN